MAVTVTEQFDSRHITVGRDPTAELCYTIRGTNDNVEVMAELLAESPALFDPWGNALIYLPRTGLSINPVGDELWEGFVRYGLIPQTNESVTTFDTGGGVQHITQSLETIGKYPTGTAPDCKGAIGVTADSVEGVDIAMPIYQFSETHYLPDATVTTAYRATIFDLTGKVNNWPFKNHAEGECLFLGASGAKRGYGDWEINFRFASSPNVTGLQIGDIEGINKKGWEYLWVRYADTVDSTAKALVKRPVAAYVERVYEDGNFTLLGI